MPILPGKATQLGHLVEWGVGAAIVHGEHVHQIAMAHVVAAEVVVPFEIAAVAEIAVAHVPIACGADAMNQAAVMQYRQVKTTAIPAHQLWRVALEQVVKFAQYRGFVVFDFAYGADVYFVFRPAQATGNRHHAVQMQRQKIAAILGAAFLQSVFHHIGIGDVIGEIMQCAYGMCIGDGFNVKGEYRCHGSSLGGLQAAYCTDLASTWRKNLSKAAAKACGASHCSM